MSTENDNFDDPLQAAISAVKNCFYIAEKIRHNLKEDEAMCKLDESPVTIADLAVQIIVSKTLTEFNLKSKYILAEEDIDNTPISFLEKVVETLNNSFDNTNEWSVEKIKQIFHSTHITENQISTHTTNSTHTHTHTHIQSYWVLDPIDGTKGFIDPTGKSQYAIALSYIELGEPIIGVLGCPNLPHTLSDPKSQIGCIGYAKKSEGAHMIYLNSQNFKANENYDWTNSTEFEIFANCPMSIKYIKIAESSDSGHSNHTISSIMKEKLDIQTEPIRMTSQAKYLIVARGECDSILRFPRLDYKEYVWDHCAGAIIVEEAGGMVTHADGQPLNFKGCRQFNNSSGIVVSGCETFHSDLLKKINEIAPQRIKEKL